MELEGSHREVITHLPFSRAPVPVCRSSLFHSLQMQHPTRMSHQDVLKNELKFLFSNLAALI